MKYNNLHFGNNYNKHYNKKVVTSLSFIRIQFFYEKMQMECG